MSENDWLKRIQAALGFGVADGAVVPPSCEVHPTATITSTVELGERVIVGRNVYLNKCVIGDDVVIEDNTIVGYKRLTGVFWRHPNLKHQRRGYEEQPPARIGRGSLIRPNCLIYPGVTIGENCWINFGVLLRDGTIIGDRTSIGNLVACEGNTTIGSNCLIHSQTHLTLDMTIEDEVFLGMSVVTMNTRRIAYRRPDMSVEGQQGPTIKRGARIGSGATISAGVTVGANALVGAGAIITKDVPDAAILISRGAVAATMGQVPEDEWL